MAEPETDPSVELARLRAENAELQRQVAKAPPLGPPAGSLIHFKRGGEVLCRPGSMVSDGYVESVATVTGVRLHALIEYGDPLGSPPRIAKVAGVDQERPHGFQTNRAYSPLGDPDTWHLAEDCPFVAASASLPPVTQAP